MELHWLIWLSWLLMADISKITIPIIATSSSHKLWDVPPIGIMTHLLGWSRISSMAAILLFVSLATSGSSCSLCCMSITSGDLIFLRYSMRGKRKRITGSYGISSPSCLSCQLFASAFSTPSPSTISCRSVHVSVSVTTLSLNSPQSKSFSQAIQVSLHIFRCILQ